MNRWFVLIWLSLPASTALAQQPVRSDALSLSGVLIDHTTKQPVKNGRLSARIPTGNVQLGTSGDSGKFSGTIPDAATILIIERTGYQSRSIPIQQATRRQSGSAVVLIPLLPIVAQTNNKPYGQTEQTAYVQDNTVRKSGADTPTIQHNTFRVSDAIRDTPLQANVCFFFTKSGKKTCLTSNALGIVSLAFRERDIVAIEATATDYEPYAGNLVVDQLKGNTVQHAIQMNRTLTLLAVDARGATACSVNTGRRYVPLMAIQTGRFAAYDLLPGRLELSVSYGRRTVKRFTELKSGLNWTSFVERADTIAIIKGSRLPATVDSSSQTSYTGPELTSTDSLPLIYFEQSSYLLKPDSQRVLQQVAQYMKNHPGCTLEITGHTDNVGAPSLNQTLSMYRAMVTASFLSRQGVNDNRFIKSGIGGSQPLVDNDSEANKARNRRVSLKLINTL